MRKIAGTGNSFLGFNMKRLLPILVVLAAANGQKINIDAGTKGSLPLDRTTGTLSVERVAGLTALPGLAINSKDYAFAPVTPGGTIVAGPSTVTLTPCPKGVAGANAYHYLYISGGSGAAENVLITGGTCTSGAATGTITFTAANGHSGAWTIASATAGIQEALNSVNAPRSVRVADGELTIRAPITLNGYPATVAGGGRGTTILNAVEAFPETTGDATAAVFRVLPIPESVWTYGTPGMQNRGHSIRDLAIIFPQSTAHSAGAPVAGWNATKADLKRVVGINANNTIGFEAENIHIQEAWNGITLNGVYSGGAWVSTTGQYLLKNIHASCYNECVSIDGALEGGRIMGLHVWPYGVLRPDHTNNLGNLMFDPTTVALRLGRVDGVFVSDFENFSGMALKVSTPTAETRGPLATISNFYWDAFSGAEIGMDTTLKLTNGVIATGPGGMEMPAANYYPIKVTRGNVLISNTYFTLFEAGITNPFITLNYPGVASGPWTFEMTNCLFYAPTQDVSIIRQINSPSSAIVTVTGVHVWKNTNTTFSVPLFKMEQTNAAPVRSYITGVMVTSAGTGSGVFFSAAKDEQNSILYNHAPGYTLTTNGTNNGSYMKPVGRSYFYGMKAMTNNVQGPEQAVGICNSNPTEDCMFIRASNTGGNLEFLNNSFTSVGAFVKQNGIRGNGSVTFAGVGGLAGMAAGDQIYVSDGKPNGATGIVEGGGTGCLAVYNGASWMCK